MATESGGCRPAAYSRRHPEQTVLYRIVQQHLETYLMLSREGDWDGHAVPAYVERDSAVTHDDWSLTLPRLARESKK